jgi:hypothetical protein
MLWTLYRFIIGAWLDTWQIPAELLFNRLKKCRIDKHKEGVPVVHDKYSLTESYSQL